LVELLTVLAIAGILAALVMPAMQSLQKVGRFNQSVYSMADSLSLARSYAMAKNTYVYVGLTEVDRSQSSMATPQNIGVGRVVISIVATNDGTSDLTGLSAAGLTQVRQAQKFDFFHVTSSGSFLTTTGNMAKPQNISSSAITLVPIPAATSPALPFSLPLGATTGSGKYNFSNTNSEVLCFNPQGEVLIPQTVSGVATLVAAQWLEIDLQPFSGNGSSSTAPQAATPDRAALLVDGTTGSVNVYRP
jgi:Tfp pilus assembly protein FimT